MEVSNEDLSKFEAHLREGKAYKHTVGLDVWGPMKGKTIWMQSARGRLGSLDLTTAEGREVWADLLLANGWSFEPKGMLTKMTIGDRVVVSTHDTFAEAITAAAHAACRAWLKERE